MKLPSALIIKHNRKKRGRASISFWRIIAAVGLFIMIIGTMVVIGGAIYLFNYEPELFSDDEAQSTSQDSTSEKDCNVYAEKIHGTLDTYAPPEGSENTGNIVGSEDIVRNIETADKDPKVKGVLIDIDSTGGYAVAADEIAKALRALNKPSVAVIRGYGDSAAYWAATGADIIFASPISDVGSIGITSSYLENAKYNSKEGYTYSSRKTK